MPNYQSNVRLPSLPLSDLEPVLDAFATLGGIETINIKDYTAVFEFDADDLWEARLIVEDVLDQLIGITDAVTIEKPTERTAA